MNEEGVVRLPRLFSYFQGSCMGHYVGLADNKGIERISGVEQREGFLLGFWALFVCTDVEVDLDLALSKAGEYLLDEGAEIPLEVFGYKGVWYADDEIAVVAAEANGASQPGLVIRPVNFYL